MARPEAAMRRALRIDMLHLAFVVNGPGRDGVGVIDRSVAARGDHLLSRRLDVTALVGRAALQDRRPAVPPPRNAEARQRLRQQRRLQWRPRPPPPPPREGGSAPPPPTAPAAAMPPAPSFCRRRPRPRPW